MANEDYCSALVRERDRERYLATLYAPAAARAALFGLHALDLELAEIVRTTTEPMLGQIRLAWWREQLQALDAGTRSAQPVLLGLAGHVLPQGVSGASLEPLEDAALTLLEGELGSENLKAYAAARGGTLFEAALRTVGGGDEAVVANVRAAGEAWALIDLLHSFRDPSLDVRLIIGLANERLRALRPFPLHARSLLALARLAWSDASAIEGAGFDPAGYNWPRGTPRRQMRLLWSMITGA